ncbi:NADH-quinone oxidoreductase subunit D [Halobacteriovorax sp. HLS]|uniref:NADH-quinone oxidoreductase subunit D n=1 Tax=Halobacteriovorax sp. HLS TaxID=2234000 RepID=UPI000FDA2949|nr:NADH-quinone oxidoreductase subunit D [Halobacteriovorax sp. HLS]
MNKSNNLRDFFQEDISFIDDHQAVLNVSILDRLYPSLEKLRVDFGYILLVDIFGQDLSALSTQASSDKPFQVTYVLLNMEYHHRIRVNVFVDLDSGDVLPSVTGLWPCAKWCEVEASEMFGIAFGDSSKLRLLTKNDLQGYPLRKSFKFSDEQCGRSSLEKNSQELFSTDHIKEKYKKNFIDEFSIGPIHPAMKGAMMLHLQVEGDDIIQSKLEVGFLHRAIEKSVESKRYSQIIGLTDRLNYFSSASNNVGWTKAVEELVGLEISDRAKAMRMVVCELARITDHAQCIGSMAQGAKILESFEITLKIRKIIFSLFEQLCGARVTHGITRIGGMAYELPNGWSNDCLLDLKQVSKYVDEIESYLTKNTLWMDKLATASLKAYDAISWGITGPNLRACGVNYDIRKVSPYYFYEDVDFKIPLGINGDSYDRYLVRLEEIRQSVKIITQVLDSLPPGKMLSDDLVTELDLSLLGFKSDAGEIYSMTEAPNGELGFYIRSDSQVCPYRVKIRPPSFFSAQAFPSLLEGVRVADAMVSLSSMNIVAGELDR